MSHSFDALSLLTAIDYTDRGDFRRLAEYIDQHRAEGGTYAELYARVCAVRPMSAQEFDGLCTGCDETNLEDDDE